MNGADRPSAYIPGDRRRALAAGATLPTRVRGAALFADISGFTPLTEALAQELGSQRASEVLTGHLNRVFHAVIAELDRFGGDVIYFSGDAITCWLDGDDGSRATASGIAMQDAIKREGLITTPGGQSFTLGLKVAVAVGAARRFVVGDPKVQLIDVLAGSLVDRIADTEHLAQTGEVVLHESAVAAMQVPVELGETRSSEGAGTASVVARLLQQVPDAPPEEEDTEELGGMSGVWMLKPVYERLVTSGGELLAELRPAYPLFVSFGGIDYDGDEAAPDKLDEFVRAAQRLLSNYGGNVLQLTLGDKGAYLYGVFGTPLAHEDDAERTCAAALELTALQESTAAREIRIGIAYGRLRSGTYGHARRRTFVCLGDAVNLAARLMSKAPPESVYVSDLVMRATGDAFAWVALPPLALKGKAAPVAAYALQGKAGKRARRATRDALPLVGRSEELAALNASLDAALAGHGGIVGVSAEAGMGKSRLAGEFADGARDRGILVAAGECQPYGTSTAYFVWRDIWRTLFGCNERASAAEQVAALEGALREIDPQLVARMPLLDAVLGLAIGDSALTAAFDPKLRKASLEELLGQCLRAAARRGPVVVLLEDCHWLDPLSRDLLEVLARTAASAAVLLVVVYRPEAALPQGLALGRLPHIRELTLADLDEGQMAALVAAKLAQRLGAQGEAADTLRDLVVARAQGNPFYAEEIINYVHDRGIDPRDESALRTLELPESLHSLILSRIDKLAESPRSQLKVASVVGRVFQASMLPCLGPEQGQVKDVRADLGMLTLFDLVGAEGEEEEAYAFKHAVTQEVAYESLPYALRATLHGQVGRTLERRTGGQTEIDLLAHHYWQSDDEAKKRLYLGLAAQAAQAAYANAAAIEYYERLAPLLPDVQRVDALLQLGKVLELTGEWDRARGTETDALDLAQAIGDVRACARCEAALAEVARKQNHFDEAAERLGRAGATFSELGDDAGLGQVLHLQGTLATQRGSFPQARSHYEASLAIRRRLGDLKMMASVLSNLGIVAEYEGDYALARSLHEQALEVRTALSDAWAIAVSLTNLGMIASLEGHNEQARGHFEESLRLNREVGDSSYVAIGHNNLGNALRDLGDHSGAHEHYSESLRHQRDHDDSWALAFLLEDVSRLAALARRPQLALQLLGAADARRDQIEAPRTALLEQQIAAALEPAAASLNADEREAARAEGRRLDASGAIALALAFNDSR